MGSSGVASVVEQSQSLVQAMTQPRATMVNAPADLSWEHLKKVCLNSPKGAQGLDHWAPADFTLFSDEAFQWLASLLNIIEGRAPWPTGTLHAKASFLLKDMSKLADPMAYRVLLILPSLYRRWAAARLHNLYPWVSGWANSYMYAGIPGLGAADG